MESKFIEQVLNLKEDEMIKLLEMGIDGESEDSLSYIKISNKNFNEIYCDSVDELDIITKVLCKMYEDEITSDLMDMKSEGVTDGMISILSVDISLVDGRPRIFLQVPYISSHKAHLEKVINTLMLEASRIEERLNFILLDYKITKGESDV